MEFKISELLLPLGTKNKSDIYFLIITEKYSKCKSEDVLAVYQVYVKADLNYNKVQKCPKVYLQHCNEKLSYAFP